MTTGRDPGVLGIYGFRNRRDHSYDSEEIATSSHVKEPRIWDILGEAGYRTLSLHIPGTYPPKPVNGIQVSGMLAPDMTYDRSRRVAASQTITYPARVESLIADLCGGAFITDIRDYRYYPRRELASLLFKMTSQHFKVVRSLLKTEPWDFCMFVEVGPDRLHHAYWRHFDPAHPNYSPEPLFRDVFYSYYSLLDNEIGALLESLDAETSVMLVSDHGAQSLAGGICINEWLIQNGWLKLAQEYPQNPTSLRDVAIAWRETKAWAKGGHYCRVYLNVADREPEGTIPSTAYDSVRGSLARMIAGIKGPNGEQLRNRVFFPNRIYQKTNGVPPDLLVYFDDLAWRSVGSVGYEKSWTPENDTGSDDASHSEEGIFVLWSPKQQRQRVVGEIDILDIAPTVLRFFGLPVPTGMQGRNILDRLQW